MNRWNEAARRDQLTKTDDSGDRFNGVRIHQIIFRNGFRILGITTNHFNRQNDPNLIASPRHKAMNFEFHAQKRPKEPKKKSVLVNKESTSIVIRAIIDPTLCYPRLLSVYTRLRQEYCSGFKTEPRCCHRCKLETGSGSELSTLFSAQVRKEESNVSSSLLSCSRCNWLSTHVRSYRWGFCRRHNLTSCRILSHQSHRKSNINFNQQRSTSSFQSCASG